MVEILVVGWEGFGGELGKLGKFTQLNRLKIRIFNPRVTTSVSDSSEILEKGEIQ